MDSRTPEVELPVVAETQAEGQTKPRPCAEPEGQSFRFDDPYWDDAFDSYHDPTLRTCCRR